MRAHHPLIVVESDEAERARSLIEWVSDRLNMAYVHWTADKGLLRSDLPSFEVKDSDDPKVALDYILESTTDTLYHLRSFERQLDDPLVEERLIKVSQKLFSRKAAVLMDLPRAADVSAGLTRVSTTVRMAPPTPEQYHTLVTHLLRDLHRRMPIEVRLSGAEVGRLINQLNGLSFFEVKKILTKVIVEAGRFSAEDIPKVAEAKKEIIERSGVLEYFTAEESMADVAGLTNLKGWLRQRRVAFSHPERAREFGLTAPRGILLLGVQGCGKSLCAKAIAAEWQLPLIRLDPSILYNKYFGESEKNLRRAIHTAEAMAPIVLWIDEMEKAFASGGGDQDSGTSSRIFGTFLAWMQEKKEGVFVIATCNDISRLPPELVRKGRFDEIFFVDLPSDEARRAILEIHLRRRERDPAHFNLEALSAHMRGFSGAEIEQVVVSGLYAAFSAQRPLDDRMLLQEIERTVPLSTTAKERVEKLQAWAAQRAVPAE